MLGWVFTGLLLVLVLACIGAGRGTIPLNHFVGIRLPALMRSDAAWRAGHTAGVAPAGVAFVVALVFSAIGLIASPAYAGAIAAFVIGVGWSMLRATRAARTA